MQSLISKRIFWKNILQAGLLAGTLDIAAAFIQFYLKTHKDATLVLRYIASAVFGKVAYSAGSWMLFAGLLFHYTIAFIFTFFYFLICPFNRQFSKSFIINGILYGIFIWVVMNMLVVPMSHAVPVKKSIQSVIISMSIIITMVALPITYFASGLYKKTTFRKI